MMAKQTAISGGESDEVLIADPRGGLTPAQMVDQKLLGVLGSCPRSLHEEPAQPGQISGAGATPAMAAGNGR
jgi:hypothetical protein